MAKARQSNRTHHENEKEVRRLCKKCNLLNTGDPFCDHHRACNTEHECEHYRALRREEERDKYQGKI